MSEMKSRMQDKSEAHVKLEACKIAQANEHGVKATKDGQISLTEV